MILGKKILLVSPEPWDHIFVSKHHYALTLAQRGNWVYFLNPPVKNRSPIVKKSEHNNLFVVEYAGFIKGFRFLPFFIRKLLVHKKWNELETLCEVQFDIIWSFDNSVFYDFQALPTRVLKISHIVDMNMNYQIKKAASTADYCFGVTNALVTRAKKYNHWSIFINHGVNEIFFQVQAPSCVNFPGSNSIKIGYLGNLAMRYIDWRLLFLSVSTLPQADFIFVGPGKEECNLNVNLTHSFKKKVLQQQNAFFLSEIPYKEIPRYLAKCDVLLIAYQENYHPDQSNPHKMLEYLASGKPVVTTYTAEYGDKEHLIYMSKSNEDYIRILRDVINHIDRAASAEASAKRKRYARANTYAKQISRIEEYIYGKA